MEEKLSPAALQNKLDHAHKQVAVNALYRHYKGNVYKVVGLAILESTNEICVIYTAQYGTQLTFVRPVSVWLEQVEVDGKTLPRFAKVDVHPH